MLYPALEEIYEFVGKYDVVPICEELYMDFYTPIRVLYSLRNEENYFLLESLEGEKKVARYSFLGFRPYEVIKSTKGENPFQKIKQKIGKVSVAPICGMPPFIGGAVGYVGYESIQYVKPICFTNPDDLEIPEMMMMLFDEMIVFDHERQRVMLIALMPLTEDLEVNYTRAKERIKGLKEKVEKEKVPYKHKEALPITFVPDETKESYKKKLEKIKAYLREGDIFQAVLSTKFHFRSEEDLFEIYRALRMINPSPYMYLIKQGDLEIAGASPEMLVRVVGKRVTTMPIAGTRPRGKTDEEDRRLKEELLGDGKENAEHDMLVDLGRNDIGMVSQFGTVKVTRYKEIYSYSHLMHMVSEVEGSLMDEKDGIDALGAILPAGTLSGAPKIRAMEIIEELEERRREVYGGAIGYISFEGTLDMCIAIRTIVKKGSLGVMQAGAGIVLDSIPEVEYEEVINKLSALIKATRKVGEME